MSPGFPCQRSPNRNDKYRTSRLENTNVAKTSSCSSSLRTAWSTKIAASDPVANLSRKTPRSPDSLSLKEAWRREGSEGTNKSAACRGRETEEMKRRPRPCSYAPVDSRNIFARLTEALSRRLLVRASDVGARLLSDLLLAPAFAFFRGGARRPRLILPARSSSYH